MYPVSDRQTDNSIFSMVPGMVGLPLLNDYIIIWSEYCCQQCRVTLPPQTAAERFSAGREPLSDINYPAAVG